MISCLRDHPMLTILCMKMICCVDDNVSMVNLLRARHDATQRNAPCAMQILVEV